MQIRAVFFTVVLFLFARIAAEGAETQEDWIQKLRSDKPSEYRIAQVFLARPGLAPLRELDELAKTPDDRLRQRLKEIVALLLLNGVEPRQLQRHRNLYALPAAEFAQARQLVNQLRKAVRKAEREFPDAPEGVQWYHLDAKASEASVRIFELHGWAVPALLELTEDRDPFLKWLAIRTIIVPRSGLLPPAVWERLKNDRTVVVRDYGDYLERSTIAREISTLIEQYPRLAESKREHACPDDLPLIQEFQGAASAEDHIPTGFQPGWSCDDYWRAVQGEMEARWDPNAADDHAAAAQPQRDRD